jgi:heme exporter protein B
MLRERPGTAVSVYAGDVAALARKDLRLELRARDTLPAMLLFVLSTLVVFHFAVPRGSGSDAAYGLLWVALVFTALLGLARAWEPERAGGVLDGLLLTPCDRSAIWLGKTLATLAFLVAAEIVALPAFALFFAPLHGTALAGVALADVGICAVGSLVSAMAASSRTRELILPLLFLPLAIPLVVGGVGSSVSAHGSSFLLFLALYDGVFSILSWASFEYVVTE